MRFLLLSLALLLSKVLIAAGDTYDDILKALEFKEDENNNYFLSDLGIMDYLTALQESLKGRQDSPEAHKRLSALMNGQRKARYRVINERDFFSEIQILKIRDQVEDDANIALENILANPTVEEKKKLLKPIHQMIALAYATLATQTVAAYRTFAGLVEGIYSNIILLKNPPPNVFQKDEDEVLETITTREKLDIFWHEADFFPTINRPEIEVPEKYENDRKMWEIWEEVVAPFKSTIKKFTKFYNTIERTSTWLKEDCMQDLEWWGVGDGSYLRFSLIEDRRYEKRVLGELTNLTMQMTNLSRDDIDNREIDYLLTELRGQVLNLLVMYEQVAKYLKDREFADLVRALSDRQWRRQIVEDHGTWQDEEEIVRAAQHLRIKMVTQIALWKYKEAKRILISNHVPIADWFLGRFQVPERITNPVVNDKTAVVAAVMFASDFVRMVQDDLQKPRYTIDEIARAILNPSPEDRWPLFQWNGYKDKTRDLLTGEEITLRSVSFEALKSWYIETVNHPPMVRNIHFKLRLRNQSQSREFIDTLSFCRTQLRHHGDSYFRIDGKFYAVTTSPATILLQNSNLPDPGNPVEDEFGNIRHLSPFATWSVKLLPAGSRNCLPDLIPYLDDEIDMYLTGQANFFDSGHIAFNWTVFHIDKFYKSI